MNGGSKQTLRVCRIWGTLSQDFGSIESTYDVTESSFFSIGNPRGQQGTQTGFFSPVLSHVLTLFCHPQKGRPLGKSDQNCQSGERYFVWHICFPLLSFLGNINVLIFAASFLISNCKHSFEENLETHKTVPTKP